MTIRELPEIKAKRPSSVSFEVEEVALSKWNPSIKAAVEGDENVISIFGAIGEGMFDDGITTRRVAGALRRIGQQDVTVNINSPGGDFFEGVGIFNLLREHPARVTVKVLGLAASAASVVAMAGDDIEISEVGFLMVHNAWVIAIGNRHDMREAADLLEPFDDAMAGLYAARAGVEKSVAAEWMDAERFFNGSQAVDVGLADGLLASSEIGQEQGTQSLFAVRRLDAALAKAGMPRSERRALLNEIKGGTQDAAADSTQDAAVDATQDAGDVVHLRRLIAAMQP